VTGEWERSSQVEKYTFIGLFPTLLIMRIGFVLLAVVSVLLMVILAGCIGADYVANRDIVVIRLHPDGSTAWIRSIDTGHDDSARDLVETPDGDLMIAGGRTSERIGIPSPRLVRLSPEGIVLWDRDFGDGSVELTSVALAGNGVYTAASYGGRTWRLDSDKNVQWSQSTGLEQVRSVITTRDGGLIVAGEETGRIPFGTVVVYNPDGTVSSRPPFANESVMTPGCTETSLPVGPDRTIMVTECTVPYRIIRQGAVMKLEGDGNISWKRSYGAEGLQSVWSVLEDPDGDGYLVAGFTEYPRDEVNVTTFLIAVQLDSEGNPLQVSRIDQVQSYRAPLLRSGPDGFDLLYVQTALNNGYFSLKPAVIHLSRNGSVGAPTVIDAGPITTWTDDGGYFSAGFPSATGIPGYGEAIYGRADRRPLHAIRLGPDGTLVGDREIRGVVVNYVEKVIQMQDGGYAILAMRENY
jgi:hypothetical protein